MDQGLTLFSFHFLARSQYHVELRGIGPLGPAQKNSSRPDPKVPTAGLGRSAQQVSSQADANRGNLSLSLTPLQYVQRNPMNFPRHRSDISHEPKADLVVFSR